ncbi:hypothetical protein pb186bvf_003140 [Paramecium bursaria]
MEYLHRKQNREPPKTPLCFFLYLTKHIHKSTLTIQEQLIYFYLNFIIFEIILFIFYILN